MEDEGERQLGQAWDKATTLEEIKQRSSEIKDKFTAEWESSGLDKIEIGSCLYTEFFKAVKEDLGTEYTRVLTAAEKIFEDIHKGDHDLNSEHLQLAHSLEKLMDTTSKEIPQPSTEAPSAEDRTPNERHGGHPRNCKCSACIKGEKRSLAQFKPTPSPGERKKSAGSGRREQLTRIAQEEGAELQNRFKSLEDMDFEA
ncbi:hypothetical protein CYMTET_11139 [Cymbomonas tetramitiformis]|uniref:Uncharacterized protein n=1 Tax=Cymbomonas tetramitiformis TaxID=36881 RepID=A0AAE0GMW7_9CHLO|nr:hypothetical protein CYMTET_11139 [Cymbomonas tetramitiformis]